MSYGDSLTDLLFNKREWSVRRDPFTPLRRVTGCALLAMHDQDFSRNPNVTLRMRSRLKEAHCRLSVLELILDRTV